MLRSKPGIADYDERSGEFVDPIQTSGAIAGSRDYVKVNLRLAIKKELEKGNVYNFILVHSNDAYDVMDSMHMFEGIKVIHDSVFVRQGSFQLLK